MKRLYLNVSENSDVQIPASIIRELCEEPDTVVEIRVNDTHSLFLLNVGEGAFLKEKEGILIHTGTLSGHVEEVLSGLRSKRLADLEGV